MYLDGSVCPHLFLSLKCNFVSTVVNMQRGRVATAADLKSKGGCKSVSFHHLKSFQGRLEFISSDTNVNSQPFRVMPVGILTPSW